MSPDIAEVSLILAADPDFAAAWQEWCGHRAEVTRKPFTPRAQRMQLKRLASWGVPRAIAAIEYSIAQGYQGIFEERRDAGSATRAHQPAGKSIWALKQQLEQVESELNPLRDELRMDVVPDRASKIERARVLTSRRRALLREIEDS